MLNPAPQSTPRAVAVAVAAADRRVRDSLASLLTASGQVQLVGVAGDPVAALRLVRSRSADVVVVDRELALNGSVTSFLALLRRSAPGARIVVIAWDGSTAPSAEPCIDAVVDLAEQPAALLDAVLERRPGPCGPARPRAHRSSRPRRTAQPSPASAD